MVKVALREVNLGTWLIKWMEGNGPRSQGG